MSYPANDTEWEDRTIAKATDWGEDGWQIDFEEGLCLGIPNGPITPEPGMAIRLYGRGFGYAVRGVFIEGHEFRYETEAAMRTRFDGELAQKKGEDQARLEAEGADRDARWDALPAVYRQRRDRFIENNPTWRRDYEPYELFVCEQAHLIAAALKTRAAIADFHKADWEAALRLVPGLDGGHSGNTLGMACKLAVFEIEYPEGVVRQHGAMSPVAGSAAHGDISAEEMVAKVLMGDE